MKSPIRKLLVLTNQSPFGRLVYFPYRCLTAKEANMQKYTKYAVFDVRRYINFSDFSSFIFKAPIEKVASCR